MALARHYVKVQTLPRYGGRARTHAKPADQRNTCSPAAGGGRTSSCGQSERRCYHLYGLANCLFIPQVVLDIGVRPPLPVGMLTEFALRPVAPGTEAQATAGTARYRESSAGPWCG